MQTRGVTKISFFFIWSAHHKFVLLRAENRKYKMKSILRTLLLLLCLMIGRVGYGQEVWELVTDYSNLSTTDTYVIAGNTMEHPDIWWTMKNDEITKESYISTGSRLTISDDKIVSAISDKETWSLVSSGTTGVYYIKSTLGNYYLQCGSGTQCLITKEPSDSKLGNAKWKIHYTDYDNDNVYSVTGLFNEFIDPVKMLAVYEGTSTTNWHAEARNNYKWIRSQEVVLFKKTTQKSASITSAEYATFSSPYALDFSAESGLTVYTATVNAAKMKVSLHEVTSKKIPANTAVVLHGTQGTYTGSIVETAENLVGNDLKVATSEMSGAEHSIYVLNKKNGVLGFYKLSNTGKLEAGKAYLTLNASAPMLTFTADEATSVGHARSSVKTDSLYFTLDGRRVMYPSRGVFIHNGRKVVIK